VAAVTHRMTGSHIMTSLSWKRLRALTAGAILSLIWPASGQVAAQAPIPRPPAAAPQEVDVALVLAVDVSGSIDYEEAELQRKGLVDAFLNKEVLDAIRSGSLGRIGVSVVYFSSKDYGFMSIPVNWMVIENETTAQTFVKQLVQARRPSARGTSISDALEYSLRQLETGPFHAVKQVIDVSGDGVNNAGRPVEAVRDEVLAKGITINALPIMDDTTPQDLDKYFEGCVTGGPASFVIPAKGFVDFARAIRRKLILEISGLTPGQMPEKGDLLIKVADQDTAPQAAPARPIPPRAAPNRPRYEGGCDYPMFGGYFRGFGGYR
jgi:hypothetical protein